MLNKHRHIASRIRRMRRATSAKELAVKKENSTSIDSLQDLPFICDSRTLNTLVFAKMTGQTQHLSPDAQKFLSQLPL